MVARPLLLREVQSIKQKWVEEYDGIHICVMIDRGGGETITRYG